MQHWVIIGTGVIAFGAWLRWAVKPVMIAYLVGRHTGRVIAEKTASRG